LARLNTNGTVDSTFNPMPNLDVYAIAIQEDGKILIGGSFTNVSSKSRNFIARLNADGTVDTLFDPNATNRVSVISVQPDGKILVGGFFNSFMPNGGSPVTRNGIARLNVDGTVDSAFNPNANNGVVSIASQSDGRIVIAGAFTALGPNGGPSIARNTIARLNIDGSVDAAFDPAPNNFVSDVALAPDGKILVGGAFDTIGGASRNLFARLANDTAAIQNLAVTESSVTWTRSAAETQLSRVTFERSTDGVNYTFLGNGARIGATNDFALTGQNLPAQQNLYVRARGVYRGAAVNGSELITESVRYAFLPPPLHLAFTQQPANVPQNVSINPAVTVQILDASNNPVNTNAAVTISIGTNPSSGTLSGTTTVAAVNGTATFNNLSIDKLGTGYTLSASGTNLTGAVSSAFNITVNAPSNIVVNSGSGQSATINSAFANPLRVKVTDVNGNPVSGVAVSFAAPANGAGGTFANNTATITTTTDANGLATASTFAANSNAGSYAIVASINGGSPSTGFGMTNLKANQTISVTTHAPASAIYHSQFNVSAVSSAGLSIAFSSSGSCTNNGATFTMNSGTGNCTVKYDQAGDANHNAATQMSETVTANKAAQSITFDAVAGKVFGDSDFAVNATATSGLSVNLAASGSCTNNGSTIHITGAGSCSINASQAGDSSYAAASDVLRSLNIAKAGSTTSVTVSDAIYDGSAHGGTAIATGVAGLSQNLAVIYSGRNGTSYSSETAPSNAGEYTAAASYTGDANHNSSSDSKDFTIGKASQTIDLDALSDKTFGDGDFAVSSSASSGLAVSFASSGQCAITSSSVHLNGAGSCTIIASQTGDSNYNSAAEVSRSFQISKAATITQLSYVGDANNGATFTAAVTSPAGTPGGSATFKNDGVLIPSCVDVALSSGQATCPVSSLPVGSHTFTAEYSGEVNFNASNGSLNAGLDVAVFEFSQAAYSVGERAGSVTINVKRSGDISAAASVDYATDDGSIPSVAVPCAQITGLALERCDYTRAAGTLEFAPNETEKSFVVLVNDDSYAEGTESISLRLSSPGIGAVLGSQATATLQITDDAIESAGNPVDDDTTFVRLQYHDFLNREADPDGLKFWSNNISNCDTDACGERKRIDTSAAFYLSIEFQETGYLVERFYQAAYGDATGVSTLGGQHQLAVPMIRLREFLRDTQEIGRGVIVNQAGWQQQLENRKQAFAREFVSRERFRNAYPDSLNAELFVVQLNANAGGVLTDAEMAQLESVFGGSNASSADVAARAQVVRSIAENQILNQREFNRAFVLMQYFGYLRRNPDDAQDTDYTGYDFWVKKMEQFGGNYQNAEMVKAFITSSEYRQRFGQ
jgi:uncharacterized delta-60 repeat protein